MDQTRALEIFVMTALAVTFAVGVAWPITAAAAKYSPAFDFEKVLDTYFDDSSGLISFTDYKVIFAPDGEFNGLVAVLDPAGRIVANFPFYKEYRPKEGIYGRVQVETPADVSLTEPGIYTIVFLVDGTPVTRLPVKLERVDSGDDPFGSSASYRFDGYWRTFAFLTMGSFKGEAFPVLNYWLGGMDLAPGKVRGQPFVTLYRNGTAVAHSQRTQGHYREGHFKHAKISLYHPHAAGKEANARPFLLADWLVDGDYEVRVTRQPDGALLRSFDFEVANGAFVPHPRTVLGYQPQTDYIAPRVQKRGATSPELVEAIWIEDR